MFSVFLGVFWGSEGGKNPLVFWVVSHGIYLNTKEKKIREVFEPRPCAKRGFTKFSVFLKRVSLLNTPVRTNFVAFPRKNQERASKFGSILGRDRVLVNNCSAAAGRAPNWTRRALNSSNYHALQNGNRPTLIISESFMGLQMQT